MSILTIGGVAEGICHAVVSTSPPGPANIVRVAASTLIPFLITLVCHLQASGFISELIELIGLRSILWQRMCLGYGSVWVNYLD